MKKLITVITFLFVCVISKAQLFTESFNTYTVGSNLTANGWSQCASGTDPLKINGTNLSYSGYYPTNTANSLYFNSTASNYGGYCKTWTGVNSGSIYMSFLFRDSVIATAATTGDYFITMGSDWLNNAARVLFKSGGGVFQFGTRKSTGTDAYSTTLYSPNQTHLVVLKYTFNTGSSTDDVVGIYVDPTLPGTEPGSFTVTAPATTDFTNSIGNVFLRLNMLSSNVPDAYIDAIKVGTSWTDLFSSTCTPPNVTVTSPSICSGNTAQPIASGATSYTWTGGLSAVSNPTTPVLTTTTTYTVTGTTGSCTNTAVATITVNPLPNVTVSSPSICSGNTAQPIAGGATSYSWTGGLSAISNPTTPVLTTTTTYTVTGTTGSCTNTAVATVTVTPLPNVMVSSPSICSGNTAQPIASGATSYTWTGGLSAISNPTTPVLTTTTTYTVTGTTGSCSNSAVATVTVTSRPNVTVNSPSICSGNTAQPIASGATSYSWTGGLSAVSNPTTLVLTTTTTYTVTGTTGSCTNTAVATVTVNSTPSTPSITQSHDTLYSSTIFVGATYNWYLNGNSIPIASTTTPYYKFTSQGTYTLKVVNIDCPSNLSAGFLTTPLGVRNNTLVKEFSIYPNPTDGKLVVNINLTKLSTLQLRLYSTDGREIYAKVIGNIKDFSEELNISEFSKGIYILKLQVNDEVSYQKVVKQ